LGWVADAAHDSWDPGFDASKPVWETEGGWQRALPLSSNGVAKFAGRFVFEQTAASAVDGCYAAAGGRSPYDQVTAVSGAGWWLNTNNIWGSGLSRSWQGVNLSYSDDIGFDEHSTQWYQQYVGQCSAVVYQTMFIDGVKRPIAYNVGLPYLETNDLDVDIDNAPVDGLCTSVTPQGGSIYPACKNYP
jgi:hypothetical protein